MTISDINEFLEKIEKKILKDSDFQNLEHVLLCARKQILDCKKENDSLSTQNNLMESKLNKEKFYTEKLQNELKKSKV